MKNILRIFASDAKRLATNVVAVVIIIGLSVIPCLYAWFNTLSNWDPYGSEATSHLSVAVANVDAGTEVGGIELNIGDMVISNLEANDSIDWVFTETTEDAVDGVYAGDYYAALVIDESFSKDLISFLGGDVKHPNITYYENEKKNAIAPKITGKVKTTVQKEVNKAFVSTIAESMIKLGDYVVTTESGESLSSVAIGKLKSLDNDLQACIAILDSYISLIDSANSLMEAGEIVSEQLDVMMQNGRDMANNAQSSTNGISNSLDSVSDVVANSLNRLNEQMKVLCNTIDETLKAVESVGSFSSEKAETLRVAVEAIQTSFNSAMGNLDSAYLTDQNISAKIDAVNNSFDRLQSDLESFSQAGEMTAADAKSIRENIVKDAEKCQKEMQNLSDTYSQVVQPQLDNTMSSLRNSLTEVQSLLNVSGNSMSGVVAALESYPDVTGMGRESLVKSRDEAISMEKKLSTLIADIEALDGNNQYKRLLSLIQSDPDLIADFISNPVKLDTEHVYEIENNGSATAPFYIVLSIWVGSLILVAIIHTKVKEKPEERAYRNYQKFFGRYITFFLIGQLQTLITVLGSVLFVGIQCKHVFLFWLAMAITSLAFTMIAYSLTYAFGNVGEAIVVVLMVVQVAGSGGTFPIEVLPKVFQILYHYMPFAYAMGAARETIAGMYQNDYWHYLAGLGVYIIVSLIIGLVISIPCKKLMNSIDKSKGKTDLLI